MSMMRMLNAMREDLVVDYEGKGLLSFVSNERGATRRCGCGKSPRKCLLTNVKPTNAEPMRKRSPRKLKISIGGLEQTESGRTQ